MNRSPTSLPSQALLRVVIRSFGASREGPPHVTCVLRNRTIRGGLEGRCRPRHWCCPLTALLTFLLDEDLVALSELPGGLPARVALFVPLATEMLRWDVQAQATKLPAQTHLRARAIDFSVRLGALIGTFAPLSTGSPVLADAPAWADARRRNEPLHQLLVASGAPTFKEFADKKIGNHAQTVSRWSAQGTRPSKTSMGELAQAAGRNKVRSVLRYLRWHYSLSDLTVSLTEAFGSEFIMDLARVFCATLRCTARRFGELATESERSRQALELWMGTTTLAAPHLWQEPLAHAERHGATSEWRRDVERLVDEFSQLGLEESPTATFMDLLRHLPRKRRSQR